MGQTLTDRTQKLINLIGDPAIQYEVLALFETDAALYGPPTTEVLERVRFAVIKLAMQGRQMFDAAATLYQIDARDLLINAGFTSDLKAHDRWCESILQRKDGMSG